MNGMTKKESYFSIDYLSRIISLRHITGQTFLLILCMMVSLLTVAYASGREHAQLYEPDLLLTTKLNNGMGMGDKDHARVRAMIQNYETKNAGVFTHLDGDGLVVFNYVVDELARRGLPLEIAFVPLVESGYRPNARNGQHIGLWQLGPAAAKTFGIQISQKSDGRLNFVRATEAALDYLEYLNRRFDGDWLLTLAAYNAGEGRVLRSMKKNRAAGKPVNFWNLDLPPITKAYIPRVLALSQLALEKQQLEVPVESIPEIIAVKSPNKKELLEAARRYGLKEHTIKYFNPSDFYTKDGASVMIMPKEIATLAYGAN